MLDMFVISGADKFVCQSCGKELLSLGYGDCLCKCGQPWRVSYCLGNPFARMELERAGISKQTGNPYYNAGWLVKATEA